MEVLESSKGQRRGLETGREIWGRDGDTKIRLEDYTWFTRREVRVRYTEVFRSAKEKADAEVGKSRREAYFQPKDQRGGSRKELHHCRSRKAFPSSQKLRRTAQPNFLETMLMSELGFGYECGVYEMS